MRKGQNENDRVAFPESAPIYINKLLLRDFLKCILMHLNVA